LISIALAGLGPKVTRRDEGHSDFHASALRRRELFRHGRVEQRMKKTVLCLALCAVTCGCGRAALVSSDALPLQRVVIYRNGVGYFERRGHVEADDVRFKMRSSEVGDFLATLAVMEQGRKLRESRRVSARGRGEEAARSNDGGREARTQDRGA
jgi:hypothetical protein